MSSDRALARDLEHLLVRPWHDEIIEQIGHDPRSAYVERFWLGHVGPSAVWFLRYIADKFEAAPLGFNLDAELCAATIGLGSPKGANASFRRMLKRCHQFGVLKLVGPTTIEVRRILPPLNYQQVLKLSPRLQLEHKRWLDSTPSAAEVADLGDKARRLALSLLQLGEAPTAAERQLHRWRFHPAMAREAITWAIDQHGCDPGDAAAPGNERERRTASTDS